MPAMEKGLSHERKSGTGLPLAEKCQSSSSRVAGSVTLVSGGTTSLAASRPLADNEMFTTLAAMPARSRTGAEGAGV